MQIADRVTKGSCHVHLGKINSNDKVNFRRFVPLQLFEIYLDPDNRPDRNFEIQNPHGLSIIHHRCAF